MLCRERRDIYKYGKGGYGRRWSFAKLFAETWFDKIATFSKDKIKELKKFLANKTIIGEYCGN